MLTEDGTQHIAHAIESTFPQKQEIPPIVVDFVRGLYAAGVLTIDILGMERIGFRKDLHANLREISAELRQAKKDAKAGQKRAGPDDDGGDNARPTKKQKAVVQKGKNK